METNESSIRKSVPVWFWVIAILGLLWFLMDFMAFYMRVFSTAESLAKMPENQQLMYQGMPSWVNIVFALEVFGGLLGCAGLLLRKQWATYMFVICLVGVVCQTFYLWFLSDARSIMGAMAIVMPLLAIGIGLALLVFSRTSTRRGWLN